MVKGLRKMVHSCAEFISVIIHPLSKLWSKNQVRILCYHRVCDLPETNDSMMYLNVPPEAFAQQMAFLSQNGFNVITLEQFIEYKDGNRKPPSKTVVITFDDGYRDNYINAFPILEKYNFKGTFFIVTDYIDGDRIFHWLKLGEKSLAHSQENKQYWLPLSRGEILDMSAQGACFGSHTRSHCSLNSVDKNVAMEELKGSKECLEKILLKPVRCFCYPYGDMNNSVKSLVKAAGYSAAVSTLAGGNTLKSDFFELRRIAIPRQYSYVKFKRRVEGAYDWIEYLLPAFRFIQQIIFQKQGGK